MTTVRVILNRIGRLFRRRGTLYIYLKSGNIIKLPVSKDGGWEDIQLGNTNATHKFKGLLVGGVRIQPTQIEAVVLK